MSKVLTRNRRRATCVFAAGFLTFGMAQYILGQRATTKRILPSTSKTKVSFEEKLLATIPNGLKALSIRFSPDGNNVAYYAKQGDKEFVVNGNLIGPAYDRVGVPVFSYDSRLLAYKATRDNRASVVINNRPSRWLENASIGDVVFSPNSVRLAYEVFQNGKEFLIFNGRKDAEFRQIKNITFSPDGRKIAYVADDDFRNERGSILVANGKKQGAVFSWIGDLKFSPDGKRIIHEAHCDFTGAGNLESCIVDGKVWLKTNGGGKPVFSPDGTKFAYEVRESFVSSTTYTPHNGNGIETAHVFVGSRREPTFQSMYENPIVFSPDGSKVAYPSITTDKLFVIVGGKKEREFTRFDDENIAPIVFSPDGRRLAYRVGSERSDWFNDFIVLDGQVIPIQKGSWRPLAFSPNSKRLAYAVKKGDIWFIEVTSGDGKTLRGEGCDEILTDLYFSPDSNKVAYGAKIGNQLWWKVMEVRD